MRARAAARASSVKVFGTEEQIEIYRLLLDVLGPAGLLQAKSPAALLQGQIEEAHQAAGGELLLNKQSWHKRGTGMVNGRFGDHDKLFETRTLESRIGFHPGKVEPLTPGKRPRCQLQARHTHKI